MKECLIEDDRYYIPKTFVYAHYQAWCEEKGHNPYPSPTFWSKLKEQKGVDANFRTRAYNHDLLPNQPRCLKNFKFNPDATSTFVVKNIKLKTEDHSISDVIDVPLVVKQ